MTAEGQSRCTLRSALGLLADLHGSEKCRHPAVRLSVDSADRGPTDLCASEAGTEPPFGRHLAID
jgi:hypothetical protein